jgi:sec-independent protein translocase protein TatB
MLDIGWSEMAIILLVALIVIGPKDLPKVARTVGRWAAKGRALAREFQNSLEDMAREAELDKVKAEIEKAGRVNPKRMIENTIDPKGEIGRAMDMTASGGREPPAAKPARPAEAEAEADAGAPAAVAQGESRTSASTSSPTPAAAGGGTVARGGGGAADGDRGGNGEAERARRPEPVE